MTIKTGFAVLALAALLLGPSGCGSRPETDDEVAVLETNYGRIVIEFLPKLAPKHIENFKSLASTGFYDGTRFHRVIRDFMIQGGDPLSKDDTQVASWGTGGPGYQFADEFNDEPMVQGLVAMANSGPNTNGSQFFIITAAATPWLQGKHTQFAKVVKGLDIAMKIQGVETTTNDRPAKPVILEKVTLK